MLHSSDLDDFFKEEKVSEEKRQLVIENSRLKRSNEQLKIDLNKLQNQFDELVNSCPQINELSRQNNLLSKEVSDLNIKNVELNRRLEISLQTNSDLSEKIVSSQNAANSSYNHQISKLNTQITYLKNHHQEEIEKIENAYNKCQNSLKQTEKEVFLLKSQISKILNLSQNYFKKEITDFNDLCSILMNPKERISKYEGNSLNSSNTNKQPVKIDDIDELNRKIDHFKSLYNSEKLKKKKIKLSFLQYQKNNEYKDFTINQLKTEIEDLKRNHENAINQIESSHKQEILSLTSKNTSQVKYKSMIIQTSPEYLQSNQPLNQSYDNHNSSGSTIYDISETSSISSINKLNKEKDESITVIEQMKAQIQSLIDQLTKSQEKQMKLREKNKSIISQLLKLEKENKANHKKLIKAASFLQQIQDENDALNQKLKANSAALDERNDQTKSKQIEIQNIHKSLNVLEKLTVSQKSDIDAITKERDRLLSLVLIQNQALESFEKSIVNMEKTSSAINSAKGGYFGKYEEEENENYNNSNSSLILSQNGNNIEWDFGTLPESIVSILRNFTENEGFSIESKIHHIFNVLSKWYNNLKVSHNNEIVELQDKLDESGIKFDNFLSDILNSMGEKTLTQEEVIKHISELSSENAILLQKVNEYENVQNISELPNEKSNSDTKSKSKTTTSKSLAMQAIKLQEKLKELHTKCHLRKIELKECKAAFIECQKRSDDEIQTLRLSNEKARNEINDLQKSLNEQQQKFKDLQDELAKMRELHAEEYNKSQEDFESILMQNSSNFDEFQNRTNADIMTKNNRISTLEKQLEELQTEADRLEKTSQFLQEENNSLKSQLDEQINESEKRFATLDKQRKDGLKELEKHFNKVHDSLIQRNKELSDQVQKLQEPKIERMAENEDKINDLKEEIAQLNLQIQQEKERYQSSTESLERQNKLLLVQNNAKIIALETNYSIKCDDIRKDFELRKKELLGFIAHQFRSFYDVKMALNEDTIKCMVKKIRTEMAILKKREEAIRKILNVKEGQSTEDALTELIMSMYPQLVEQTPKVRASK